jgi:hypothetical protein
MSATEEPCVYASHLCTHCTVTDAVHLAEARYCGAPGVHLGEVAVEVAAAVLHGSRVLNSSDEQSCASKRACIHAQVVQLQHMLPCTATATAAAAAAAAVKCESGVAHLAETATK